MFVHGKNLTFGIEIECYIPNSMYTHGRIQWRKKNFHLDGTQGWKIGTDGSLPSKLGYKPVEICSPPLNGINGLSEVVRVLDYLNQIKTNTTQKCGIHIHVDGRHLDSDNLDGLIKSFLKYEKLFFSTNGSDTMRRFNNQYCKPLNPNRTSDRYQSLNISNVGGSTLNTVEFRLFKSTLDPEIVFTWLYMCVGLVSRSTKTPRPITVPRRGNHIDKIQSFVNQIFSKKQYQIDPDYTPQENDNLYRILFDTVPHSPLNV